MIFEVDERYHDYNLWRWSSIYGRDWTVAFYQSANLESEILVKKPSA
jgi:hypothetical protein